MEEEKLNQLESAEEPSGGGRGNSSGGGSGGWGGWGFSSFSVFTDIQKAAEEISRSAVEAAKTAAKGISDLQITPESEASEEEDSLEKVLTEEKTEDDDQDRMRKKALDRLEKASDESIFGQGLKVLDDSVESLASGAWNVIGNAWKGSSSLVQRLEHSAANIADSIQQGNLSAEASSLAPILEAGKTFTAKGLQVLERVGKETVDLLISETGLDVDQVPRGTADDEQFEEVTFERCFYIYGGPEYLEELEALSNHYALLFNRKKAKLLSEQKSFYDNQLKEIQQIFRLDANSEETVDAVKGKNIENSDDGNGGEMKIFRDSSVSRAAEVAAGFTGTLGGLSANEIIQKTADRLETIHTEGVHRLSELCCLVVSQLLTVGKSVISNSNNSPEEEEKGHKVNIVWPEDSVSKARIIRVKAQTMASDVEAVSNSFITGISDITEACLVAAKGGAEAAPSGAVQEKAQAVAELIQAGRTSAIDKIRDALQYLAYVVLSTSMPAA